MARTVARHPGADTLVLKEPHLSLLFADDERSLQELMKLELPAGVDVQIKAYGAR